MLYRKIEKKMSVVIFTNLVFNRYIKRNCVRNRVGNLIGNCITLIWFKLQNFTSFFIENINYFNQINIEKKIFVKMYTLKGSGKEHRSQKPDHILTDTVGQRAHHGITLQKLLFLSIPNTYF